MTKTLLSIRPLEAYFFGGETTFGNGKRAGYFARSNRFPQQTTVLGLFRKLLFDANLDIGESFRAHETRQDFGKIDRLSPIFLLDENGIAWLPHARDAHFENEKTTSFEFSNAQNLGQAFNGLGESAGWFDAPNIEKFEAKKEMADLLISENGEAIEQSKVFEPSTRVGITKFRRSSQAADRNDAFYKQEMVQLKKGWRFAVVVDWKDGVPETVYQGKTVQFGGEKSFALVKKEASDRTFDAIFSAQKLYPRRPKGQIVLTSDASVEPAIFEHCAAAVAETTTFKNIITPKATANWAPIAKGKSPNQLYKSPKLNLLRSGSVLIPKVGCGQKVINALEAAAQFRQIGYNQFLSF